MRTSRRTLVTAYVAAILGRPLLAQTSRDSAGVLIVENARPAWVKGERLTLAERPRLVFGNASDSAYRFSQVRGVILLPDGRIAVADGGSLELRLFNPQGRFLSASGGKGIGRGQLMNLHLVSRLQADTIAVNSGGTTVALFSSAGQFVRTAPFSPRGVPRARPSLLVALLWSGLGVIAPLSDVSPHPVGMRWAESFPLKLAKDSSSTPHELASLPYMEFEQEPSGPTPVWLSPIGVFAASDDRFYAGFGDRYEILVYGADGNLHSIIRRAWRPTPITAED